MGTSFTAGDIFEAGRTAFTLLAPFNPDSTCWVARGSDGGIYALWPPADPDVHPDPGFRVRRLDEGAHPADIAGPGAPIMRNATRSVFDSVAYRALQRVDELTKENRKLALYDVDVRRARVQGVLAGLLGVFLLFPVRTRLVSLALLPLAECVVTSRAPEAAGWGAAWYGDLCEEQRRHCAEAIRWAGVAAEAEPEFAASYRMDQVRYGRFGCDAGDAPTCMALARVLDAAGPQDEAADARRRACERGVGCAAP